MAVNMVPEKKYKRWRTIGIVFIILTLFFSMNSVVFLDGQLRLKSVIEPSTEYHQKFIISEFADNGNGGGGSEYVITYTIASEKYEQYRYTTLTKMRIALGDYSAYADLVTSDDPVIMEIAKDLRQIAGNDDELLADLALQIVHQMYYTPTSSAKYPIETIVESGGDCDGFSVLTAAILKAAGIGVVLLLYNGTLSEAGAYQEAHMQVGVLFSDDLSYARPMVVDRINASNAFIIHDGKKYVIAETTVGEDYTAEWRQGWRLGEVERYGAEALVIDV